jgi:hypothetical protein
MFLLIIALFGIFVEKAGKSQEIAFSRSSRNFGKDLEEPRSDKLYSSGDRGVKKSPGHWGTSNGELLVPSLQFRPIRRIYDSMGIHNW